MPSNDNDSNEKLVVDTNFTSDTMLNKDSSNGTSFRSSEKPKSQRFIGTDESPFQTSISVSPSMQKHFSKKLTELVEQQIEFEEASLRNGTAKQAIKLPKRKRIKLVRHGEVLKAKFLVEEETNPNIGRRQMTIKQRVVEDEEDKVGDKERIAESIIGIEEFQKEATAWKAKKHKKTFEYKSKKGINYLVEAETEFTKKRKKNNWDESKIKTFKIKSKT